MPANDKMPRKKSVNTGQEASEGQQGSFQQGKK